jgi:hypothetical protein
VIGKLKIIHHAALDQKTTLFVWKDNHWPVTATQAAHIMPREMASLQRIIYITSTAPTAPATKPSILAAL